MPSPGNVFASLPDETRWRGRAMQYSLVPQHPHGDPLELSGEPPQEEPTPLPEFPTDVPAPEPHDVPAWEPVDPPPPDPGEPQPKPRPIP
jgi:hypothetical protein